MYHWAEHYKIPHFAYNNAFM